jgi:hypothetical protein
MHKTTTRYSGGVGSAKIEKKASVRDYACLRTADEAIAKELFAFGLLLLLEIGKLLLHGRSNRRTAGCHGFVRARETWAVIGVSCIGEASPERALDRQLMTDSDG